MIPAGYGEDQPRLADDRLPIVLLVLDGLGDRGIPELGNLTPSESAATPNLDRVASTGMNGWHLPFGWGKAPTSELAHWAMFGFEEVRFPGRAVLEAHGAGIRLRQTDATLFAALRTSREDRGRLLITGRAERGSDDADAERLFHELDPVLRGHGMRLVSLGGRGEALLSVDGAEFAHVTDSDPFFESFHPWLRPLPTTPDALPVAEQVTMALLHARQTLLASTVNARRIETGRPALDVLTTKWAGGPGRTPTFTEWHGIAGAAVTSSRLYRGIAVTLGMATADLPPIADLTVDMKRRLDSARDLIARGARFVHVHTKATDEAGHTKDPFAKRLVLEALDAGLAGLADLARDAVVAVTGDHATPSVNGVMHTGEPTPFVVTGPTVRPDPVDRFGEEHAAAGWLGQLAARDLMPLLASLANRPNLMGHRLTPHHSIVLPDEPQAMPLTLPASSPVDRPTTP